MEFVLGSIFGEALQQRVPKQEAGGQIIEPPVRKELSMRSLVKEIDECPLAGSDPNHSPQIDQRIEIRNGREDRSGRN
jgi:hypothetical protein